MAEFRYQPLIELGEDKTEYYLLTKDYVSVSEFEGKPILKIEKEGLTIVMTTHDPNLMELGDVIYEMEDGELVEYEQILKSEEFTYLPYSPRSFAYCSDTAPFEKLSEWVKGVDLLYHEGTFGDDLSQMATSTFHSTASDAAKSVSLRKKVNLYCYFAAVLGALISLAGVFLGWASGINEFIILLYWIATAGGLVTLTVTGLPKSDRFSIERFRYEKGRYDEPAESSGKAPENDSKNNNGKA